MDALVSIGSVVCQIANLKTLLFMRSLLVSLLLSKVVVKLRLQDTQEIALSSICYFTHMCEITQFYS